MLKKKKYAKWGNDDEEPDWGNLKHVDDEADGGIKTKERVSLVPKGVFFSSHFFNAKRGHRTEVSDWFVYNSRTLMTTSSTHSSSRATRPIPRVPQWASQARI